VCATMDFCRLTNAGIRHRRAQLGQRSNASREGRGTRVNMTVGRPVMVHSFGWKRPNSGWMCRTVEQREPAPQLGDSVALFSSACCDPVG